MPGGGMPPGGMPDPASLNPKQLKELEKLAKSGGLPGGAGRPAAERAAGPASVDRVAWAAGCPASAGRSFRACPAEARRNDRPADRPDARNRAADPARRRRSGFSGLCRLLRRRALDLLWRAGGTLGKPGANSRPFPVHWVLRGYGPFALEDKATGAFIGVAGPWFPEGWPEPEITWALMLGQTGKGYATEAARRALAFARDTLGLDDGHQPDRCPERPLDRLGQAARRGL